MAFQVEVTRTKFFKELSPSLQKKYFSLTQMKYLPHIDNIYYSCIITGDDMDNNLVGLQELLTKLDDIKSKVIKFNKDLYFDESLNLLVKRGCHSFYRYCLGVNEMFDFFFAESLPNINTPRIVVQLRAIGLWTIGEYKLLDESMDVLISILKPYGLSICEVRENRIDYAYHTNSIQNPKKYFSDKNLEDECYSSMSTYQKVGRKRGKKLTIEYLALGNRKSNNIFFRTYNKVNEVIEKNYKEFFLDIWKEKKLINEYDHFVYSFAYKENSVASIVKGKMLFYIKYGNDVSLKTRYKSLLRDKNTTYEYLNKIIEGVLPDTTLIMNIEFQTMRKYYYYGDSFINTLPITHKGKHYTLNKIYRIMDNRKLFLDYLTSDVVSFRKKNYCPNEKDEKKIYKNFWYRLRRVKLKCNFEGSYSRDYSKELNIKLAEKRAKSAIATWSIYKGNLESDINEDLSLFTNQFNDNTFTDYDTGEILIADADYYDMKEKKKKALKSLLGSKSNSRPSVK